MVSCNKVMCIRVKGRRVRKSWRSRSGEVWWGMGGGGEK